MKITIRPADDEDATWRERLLIKHWSSTHIVSKGKVYDTATLPALVGLYDNHRAGLITYHIHNHECQLVSLNSERENLGVGTALLQAVTVIAEQAHCRRVWLITTNDNLATLRFYQKRDFTLVAVHRNALDISRKLKPEIPHVGIDGIPLRDEIELEFMITRK